MRPLSFRSTSISEEWTPFGMLIELGAACAPAYGFDLGHTEDQLFGDQADAVGLGKRYAGIEQHVDGEGALIERRQECARQQRSGADRGDHRKQRDRHDEALPGESVLEQRTVGALERAHEPAFALPRAA